ncbi:hypothetical protein [Jannaschia sp. 2305UL9-9]
MPRLRLIPHWFSVTGGRPGMTALLEEMRAMEAPPEQTCLR